MLLGSVKCYGPEGSAQTTNPTYLSIMSFNNADIEDLKIGDNDEKVQQTQEHQSPPPRAISSIHDDPAVLSVVTNKKSEQNAPLFNTSSNQTMSYALRNLQLSSVNGESEKRNFDNRKEYGLGTESKWETEPRQPQSGSTTSKFFDNFNSKSNNHLSTDATNRYFQPFNDYCGSKNNESFANHCITHSTQTTNDLLSNDNDNNQSFSGNRPYSQMQMRRHQQQNDNFDDNSGFNRYSSHGNNYHQGGKSNYQHQQRYQQQQPQQQQRQFYNHGNNRYNSNYQQKQFPKQNRETFNDLPFESDFDFDQSNQKFDKIASESEFNKQSPLADYSESSQTNNVQHSKLLKNINSDIDTNVTYTYDKKKSFFDNISCSMSTGNDGISEQNPNYRPKNQETFGNSYYQRRQDNNYNRRSTYNNNNNNNNNTNDYYRSQNQQRNYY
ncbi:unnamed protein product [Didymodactylos carnosus]|nr:unnamed protein product [Didymodactylos carnosus]CAF4026110.1 unnamed protein product [Didymodactylos carnosus]